MVSSGARLEGRRSATPPAVNNCIVGGTCNARNSFAAPERGFSGGGSGSSFAVAGEKQDPPEVHGGDAQLVRRPQRPFPALLVHFKIRSKVSPVFAREQSVKVPRRGRDIQRGVGHWRGEWFRRGTIPCDVYTRVYSARTQIVFLSVRSLCAGDETDGGTGGRIN
jgi:hypothetical protein